MCSARVAATLRTSEYRTAGWRTGAGSETRPLRRRRPPNSSTRPAASRAQRAHHRGRDLVAPLGEKSSPFDVDAVAQLALGPRIPRSGRNRALDAVAEVLLALAHVVLAADRAVSGHDDFGQLRNRVEYVGPHLRVALERERSDAKEAEITREQQVAVGDERHEVTFGVTGRRQHLDARRELRGIGDEMGHRPGADLREIVELALERGHERLVRVD